jgi:outer membrane protein OmpA-like peptidoglycan-associated protein
VQGRPAQPTPPPAAQTAPAPGTQPPVTAAQDPAAAPPPAQPRDSREFLRREGGQPEQRIDQVRGERREIREGDRVYIREPGRVIIREGGRTIIRHNEADRFAVDARDVRVERRGSETYSVIERPDGARIISVTDDEGRLIRRVRRDPAGAEIVIIDNSFAPRPRERVRETYFVDLPPPVIRIPRERYIVEADQADPTEVYEVLTAPPVERIQRRYTLDEVRYSHPVRERMPRIDLDVTFDTGSWAIAPDQLDRLDVVANGIKRAVQQNPREVFMVEGHTDAIGGDDDNLSLSDRRAESVAVALTERYQVPAENLVTQGYGEQDLKVNTQAAERANRRVTVRRITPLIDEQAANSPGRQ